MSAFFIVTDLTPAEPGIYLYLAILFYQPGKKLRTFFARLIKKNG